MDVAPQTPLAARDIDPLQEFQLRLHALTPRAFVTPLLVAVNALVYVIMVAAGLHALSPDAAQLVDWGANYGPLTTDGQWWRLLTATYLHAGFIHLAFNMYVLWDAGRTVERLVGNVGFFAMYTVSGLLGSVASIAVRSDVVSVGASGAVFGVFGCLLGVLATRRGCMPRKALERIGRGAIIFVGFNLVIGFRIEGIDMAAHIGGLVAGLLCGLVVSLPLDARGKARRSGRALLLVALGAAAIGASAALLPRADDVMGEAQHFAQVEDRVLDIFNDAIERAQAGELDDAAVFEILDRDVLPAWSEARQRLEALDLGRVAAERRQVLTQLKEYARLREDSWLLLEQGVREDDDAKLAESKRKQEAAEAIVAALKKKK